MPRASQTALQVSSDTVAPLTADEVRTLMQLSQTADLTACRARKAATSAADGSCPEKVSTYAGIRAIRASKLSWLRRAIYPTWVRYSVRARVSGLGRTIAKAQDSPVRAVMRRASAAAIAASTADRQRPGPHREFQPAVELLRSTQQSIRFSMASVIVARRVLAPGPPDWRCSMASHRATRPASSASLRKNASRSWYATAPAVRPAA